MESFLVFFFDVVIALFAFFVVAPCILNTVSLFGVQKRFADMMIKEGVISEECVKLLHPKKQLAGVIISIAVFAAAAVACYRTAPMGYLCGGIPLIAGFLKYRQILQYNSLTVKRFRNSYKNDLDINKFNKFVEHNF